MATHDVAIIGAGLAGLAAAAGLAASGRRVIVLDPAPEPGGALAAYERSGFLFPAAPAITRGFGRNGPFRTVFSLLGSAMPGPADARRYQVALPDHRISVTPEAGGTLDELRREFRNEGPALERLYQETGRIAARDARYRAAAVLTQRRTAAAFLLSYACSRELTSYFDVQARFFYGTPLAQLPLSAFVELVQAAPRPVPGGLHGLAARLRTAIVSRGGECRFGEPWPELSYRANRIAALGTSREIVEPRAVILNAYQDGSLQNLYLGMRREGIPVGMQETVIVLPSYERPGSLLSLSIASADEGQVPAEGLQCVTASASSALGSGEPLPALVGTIMPFYEDFCVLTREETFSSRRFPLPGTAAEGSGTADFGRGGAGKRAIRNLYLVPDGLPADNGIRAGLRLARKLT